MIQGTRVQSSARGLLGGRLGVLATIANLSPVGLTSSGNFLVLYDARGCCRSSPLCDFAAEPGGKGMSGVQV